VNPPRGFFPYADAAFRNGTTRFPFAGEEGYAGFRFVGGDGRFHYGWLRLAVDDFVSEGTLFEYAYETTPDTPIAAGDSDVRLTGSVDRRHFGPNGGALRGSAVIENRTDEALVLDLWIEAEHEGGAVTVHRLGSGTLAAGATTRRPVAIRVQADAPGGTYVVKVKVGRFETGRFLSFQQFTVVKEPAASEIAGGEAPFEVEPVEGDLFASSEASTAGVAGTHALGEAVPNPTDGRTWLTLSVAEAQGVRVEVLDALGRRVALLHDGPMAPGTAHRLAFDGSSLPAGVYVVRAAGETFSDVRVLTLTR
jgi:hypothetical protein